METELKESTIEQLRAELDEKNKEIAHLHRVIDNLPGSIYWKDLQGVYDGCNRFALERMRALGLQGDKHAICGKTDFDLFPNDVAECYRQHDLSVIRDGLTLSVEEPVFSQDGEITTQLSTKRPLYDERGNVTGIVGNTVDISNLKKIEQELREAKEKSEEVEQIKSDFVHNMEHDIRTPMSGVSGLADYLLSMEKDSKKLELLNDITNCANELLIYCNDILDFAKIESSVVAITEKKFNLRTLIERIKKIELPAAIVKSLELKIFIEPSVPQVVIGDSRRTLRILMNLVSNAIKFTNSGHVHIHTSLIKQDKRDLLIRFTVEDTGIGIPADKQDYVFERFVRLSQSNNGLYKGVGLGLRVVKYFMEDIGGEIDLVSNEKQGTKFSCTIPFRLPLTDDFSE